MFCNFKLVYVILNGSITITFIRFEKWEHVKSVFKVCFLEMLTTKQTFYNYDEPSTEVVDKY